MSVTREENISYLFAFWRAKLATPPIHEIQKYLLNVHNSDSKDFRLSWLKNSKLI